MTHDRRDRSRWIKQMQAKLRRDRAMPRNLSAEHRLQIKMIYADARRLGLTVDHIVPINHPLVCGLHVPWNMRLMKGGANSAKGNRFDLNSAEVLAPRTGFL